MKTLVLDAMGVIYQAGDDVAELLCPFIHENGGLTDDGRIQAPYHDASLGRLSSIQFWEQVQLDPRLEDALLASPPPLGRATPVLARSQAPP
jgi:hypothetical protein